MSDTVYAAYFFLRIFCLLRILRGTKSSAYYVIGREHAAAAAAQCALQCMLAVTQRRRLT